MQLAVNTAGGVLALALLYIYAVCRMDALQFGRHKPALVLLHIGMGTLAGSVLVHAAQSRVDAQDLAILLVAATWALVSAEQWHNGEVPHSWASRPVPLDTVPMERDAHIGS